MQDFRICYRNTNVHAFQSSGHGCAAKIGTRSSDFVVWVVIFIFYPNCELRIPNYDSNRATVKRHLVSAADKPP
ncbi:MAG: hypothetical protein AB1546_06850 [bacterium]